MGNRIHALAQQLTGKPSLDECSIEEIRHIAKRFPYFAPAQFLLLQKLQQLNDPDAEKQHRKAVLYYNDPLVFDFYIRSDRFFKDGSISVTEFSDPEKLSEETNLVEAAVIEEETAVSEPEILGDPIEQTAVVEEDEKSIEAPQEDQQNNIAAPGNDEQELLQSEQSDTTIVEETAAIVDANKREPEAITQSESTNPDPASEPVQETALTFEPFHTVDYFASQGIKVSSDEAPKDKLGKGLKSFTEWLRTMKRLPAAQISAAVETSAEKNVETLASHSVSDSNVVTEAMAEVWLKQGNNAKALDIYNKLSLLNPSKKAYFAAKIENLKQP